MASSAAAMAKWMKRPIFLTSFLSMNRKGSKSRTSAAIWQAYCDASKWVMRPTPLLPASRFFHVASVVLPTPLIRPMPVTTTRRGKLLAALRVRANIVDGVFYGADFFRVFIGDFDFEGLFEGHNEFDGVER